ncbi:MAG: FAD binding domain-containing protein, partial [Acidobacteria bacterium]|nr:FAD binding domain-containing protein [Acidobacteriota bacterium]
LATPAVLIDVAPITELSYIRTDGDEVRIGALTRHADVEHSDVLAAEVPLLAYVAAQVGDRQVRHRGTIGGSIAHGDAASDLPAALLALRGSVVVRGNAGERVIAADDFFTGFLETALAPDEVLTEIRVPRMPGAGWSYQKFVKRAADWAIVGAAIVRNGTTGIALVNMGATPLRATAAETAVQQGASDADAAAVAADGASPSADIHASVEYREHLARVLVRRGLEEAASRLGS